MIRVVLPHPKCLECSGAVELHCKCTIDSYVHVIGMVTDDFNIRTIIASDVRPVSSGNEIIYHLLEVAYSADKVMKKQIEEKFDAELMAVDLDQIICEYQSTIDKKQKAICAVDFDDNDDDDLNAIDLDSFIAGHMKDIANEKNVNSTTVLLTISGLYYFDCHLLLVLVIFIFEYRSLSCKPK